VPLGIRGIEGRTPVSGGVNAHVDKPFKLTERMTVHVTADLFNITNARPVVLFDQFNGITGSPAPNPDFLKVQHWDVNGPGPGYTGYQKPFYARFSARFVF